jgi:hypothetical protein
LDRTIKMSYALKHSFFFKAPYWHPAKSARFFYLARLCSHYSFFLKRLTEHVAKTLVFFENCKNKKLLKDPLKYELWQSWIWILNFSKIKLYIFGFLFIFLWKKSKRSSKIDNFIFFMKFAFFEDLFIIFWLQFFINYNKKNIYFFVSI